VNSPSSSQGRGKAPDISRRSFLRSIGAFIGLTPALPFISRANYGCVRNAEANVILATLLQPEQLPAVEGLLSPQMFQDPVHRAIFLWMSSRRGLKLPHDDEALGDVIIGTDSEKLGKGYGQVWCLVDDRPDVPNAVDCALSMRKRLSFIRLLLGRGGFKKDPLPDHALLATAERMF
jgi:hypothetical protein